MTAIFLLFATAIILAWKLMVGKETIMEVVEYIQSFGILSMLIFALFYTCLVSLSFPSSIFNIAAGVLFPFISAALIAMFCGLVAASITFLIARYFLHEFFCEKIKETEKGTKFINLINEDSGKIVVLLRLNPFIPAVVKSYGLGVSDISYKSYAFFTLIGQLPLAMMYVYIGWIGGKSMLEAESSPEGVHYFVLGLGIFISLISLIVSHLYFRKKI